MDDVPRRGRCWTRHAILADQKTDMSRTQRILDPPTPTDPLTPTDSRGPTPLTDPSERPHSAARLLPIVTRGGAWWTLIIALLILAAIGAGLGGATNDTPAASVPATAESSRVEDLRERFPGADLTPVLAVVTRADGARLDQKDLTGTRELASRLSLHTGQEASNPLPSSDGRAALVSVPLRTGPNNTATADVVDDVRAVARDAVPPGTTVQVTGGAAFGADIAGAFSGANVRLLLATIGIVAVLLLLTYRSPVLWLVPLSVVAFADQAAGTLTTALGGRLGWQFDAGIVSVLVFGAGTNYALLLISRYREELHREVDHRRSLSTAVRHTAPAILASNVTVVLALLTLALAALPATRGLGLASAVGLILALGAALLVLPAALAVCGRRVFWPFVPRPATPVADPPEQGTPAAQEAPPTAETPTPGAARRAAQHHNGWGRVADLAVRRPAAVLAASAVVLAVLASGLIGTRIGLTQVEKFRVASESTQGLATLAAHYPAGEAAPLTIIANETAATRVEEAARAVPGIVRVNRAGTSTDGQLARWSVTGQAAPSTDAAFQTVRDLRTATHALPDADALVGGANATELDVRAANDDDLRLLAPLILLVALLVLTALLRAVLAPVLLVLVNATSALAAIGAGTWVGIHILGFPGLDAQVPLLAFLFLVALGIDYTIFLVHRIQAETEDVGDTRRGTVRAVTATGAVITSAGLVLAAVFAALGVLPLVVLGQLGLIVGLGVLVDTLFVRPIVVPALFGLLGERMWWPRTLTAPTRHDEHAPHPDRSP